MQIMNIRHTCSAPDQMHICPHRMHITDHLNIAWQWARSQAATLTLAEMETIAAQLSQCNRLRPQSQGREGQLTRWQWQQYPAHALNLPAPGPGRWGPGSHTWSLCSAQNWRPAALTAPRLPLLWQQVPPAGLPLAGPMPQSHYAAPEPSQALQIPASSQTLTGLGMNQTAKQGEWKCRDSCLKQCSMDFSVAVTLSAP